MKFLICRRMLSALALLLAAAPAGAADDIENLVVSASRTPLPGPQVGSSFSIVDRQTIERRQSVFASDVLRDVPGLAVSRTSGFGSQTQVRVRGAEANQVLVMIDGIEANDPAGNDEFDFSGLTAYDIESIEIVRGPQSSLWGSDAAAGVISVRTRHGREPFGGGLFVEGGAFNTVNGGGRVVSNGENVWSALSASFFDTDGDSAAANGDENDGYENLTLTLSGGWDVSDTAGLDLTARYRDSTTEFDGFDFATGLPADADLASDDALALLQARGSLSLLGDRWRNTLRLTWLDSQRDQFALGVKDSSTAARKIGAYYQATFMLGPSTETDGRRLTFAIDHEETDYEQRGLATAFGDPNQDQDIDNTGYVVEYIARPLGLFDLAASIRYDDNSDFDDIATWRASGAWPVDRTDSRLHASYGTGQKAPTFVERFGFFPDQFIGNPDLSPEETAGFDIGVDQGLLGGKMRLDVTYFNETLKNEIDGFVFDPVAGGFTASNLDGTSRRKGIEADVRARITGALDATATYTYTDSSQPDPVTGRSREIRRPRHLASLNVNYAFAADRANVNLNLSYTGEQTDEIFPAPSFLGETVTLDAYTLVSLAGSYALTDSLTAVARVENILDETYSDIAGFQGPGVGAYAGMRMTFGR